MCGWIGKAIPARPPRRAISAWKLLAVIGAPRSDINTYAPASCWRCSRRSARISSPCMGWTLGVPRLHRRTCRRPVASSTWCHCRSQTSEARKPCRYAIRIMVASRCPYRLDLRAAAIKISTSELVRYSRVRATVEFTMVGAAAPITFEAIDNPHPAPLTGEFSILFSSVSIVGGLEKIARLAPRWIEQPHNDPAGRVAVYRSDEKMRFESIDHFTLIPLSERPLPSIPVSLSPVAIRLEHFPIGAQ